MIAAWIVLPLALVLADAARAANPFVRVTTPLASFDIELCQELSTRCLGVAPNTVANFLGYVDSDAYDDSFVHRSPRGFVIQGGSFTANHVGFPVGQIATGGVTVANEFNQSNVRGTVAVPLAGNDPPTPGVDPVCDTQPDSGSSGWFLSVGNNVALDCGSFTVFGVVVEPGMVVADAIDALFRLNFGLGPSPLMPDYECMPNQQSQCTGNPVPHLIYTQIERVPESSAAAGAATALACLAAFRRRGGSA